MTCQAKPQGRLLRPSFAIGWACCLALLACGAWPIDAAAAPPNVLLIVADDLGYADVGFNGGKIIQTPNLDRLAQTGVKLTDFRSCPVCSPTRAGLMTGRWPLRFGMMQTVVRPWFTHGLPTEENTLAELLAPAGYQRRGIFGKWHLGHTRRAHLPRAHGFTRYVGCYNGAIDYFTHVREGESDWHHDEQSVREQGYSTDLIADHAVKFLTESPDDKPWLMYVPFNAPHAPYQAKPDDLNRYPNIARPNRRAYAAMVDALDQAIGKILKVVESRPDADNTLILFFSDNGGIPKVGSNGPYRAGKSTVYEGGTRVAAAIRWPAGGLTGGKTFAERIGYIDVAPTLLAAADVEPPDNLDGVNILPAVRGEAKLAERPWFSYIGQGENARASVHLGKWKLVAAGDLSADKPQTPAKLELFDLATDPSERSDVSGQHPDTVAQLQRRLNEFLAWQKPSEPQQTKDRSGFVAPKDWKITAD